MKYYSQYHSHELFELQEPLAGLSKSNRWVKLADNLPWDKIEQECMKPLIRKAGQSVISPCGKQVFLLAFTEFGVMVLTKEGDTASALY